MSEIVPYFRTAPYSVPARGPVHPRPSSEGGLQKIAEAMRMMENLIDTQVKRQSSLNAMSDYAQTTVQAEELLQDRLKGLQGKDDAGIKKELDNTHKEIASLYQKDISKIIDPDVQAQMQGKVYEAQARFGLRGLQYTYGLYKLRTEQDLSKASDSFIDTIRLDSSNEKYKEVRDNLRKTYESAVLDPESKARHLAAALEQAAEAQAEGVKFNNPNVFRPFFKKKEAQGPTEGKGIKSDTSSSLFSLVDQTPVDTFEVNLSGDPHYIPFDGWRDLSHRKKTNILQQMAHDYTIGKQEERARVGTLIKDLESSLKRGNVPSGLDDSSLSKGNLISLYGETTGKKISAGIDIHKRFAPLAKSLPTMTLEEGLQSVAEFEPDLKDFEGQGAELKNKMCEDLINFVRKNDKERRDHPIKWAIERGMTEAMPDEPQKWGDFFVHRRQVSETMKQLYGVRSPVLDKEEGRRLTQYCDTLESKEVVSYLEGSSQRFGGLDSVDWIETMRSLEHPVMGDVGLLLRDDPDTASTVLRGYKYRTRNRGENIRDEVGERFDTWFKERFRTKYGSVFSSIGDHGDAWFDRVSKLVGYHLAGELLLDKEYSFNEAPTKSIKERLLGQPASIYDKNLQHSFEAIVGNIPVPMGSLGSSLLPPRGMSPEDFTNKFTTAVQQTFKEVGIADRGYEYENYRPTIEGVSQYLVKFGRSYIRNPHTGEPLVIEVSSDLKEKGQMLHTTHKDTSSVLEEHKDKTVKQILGNYQEIPQ